MRTAVVVVCLAVTLIVIAGCSTLNAFGSMLGSQVTFTQPQLQRSLDRSFPKEYDKLAGLVSLRLDKPSLSIPYDSNRLRLSLDATALTVASSQARPLGRIVVSSGLRFDGHTLGLHLQDPKIEAIENGGTGLNGASRDLINAWLAAFAEDEPIYRLDQDLIQRLVSRRIGAARIDNGVVTLDVSQ